MKNLSPINQRRLDNFVSNKRGLYSFWIFSVLFVISLFAHEQLLNYNLNEYLGLIFLGLVPTIVGHNSIYYSVKYVSPTIAAAFPLGEPIIATVLAYFIFFENISVNIYIGGFVTFSGLILISLYKKIK